MSFRPRPHLAVIADRLVYQRYSERWWFGERVPVQIGEPGEERAQEEVEARALRQWRKHENNAEDSRTMTRESAKITRGLWTDGVRAAALPTAGR